jgi:tetratricopeptide (TPR) repeat protein
MQDLLAQVEGGHGQAVGIVGEPGMGKSRLLLEFQQNQTKRRATYLEGRCLSYGRAIPYLPVLDILRNNCGITEVDSTTAIIDKVRYALQEVGMTPEEWAPFLLDVLGVKDGTDRLSALSPEAIKARTFETLRQLSLRGSRRRPLLFAVEDLQWVDRTSEDFFTLLVESLPGAPILFLSTYRPGYRPPWMEKSYSTQIPLQPLSPQDSLSVVQSVLQTPQAHGPLAQVIIAKAEGNPFFLEELARSMGEGSDLPPALPVPDTLQGVIMARIDRLPDRPKQLLQTASVLGREFSLRLLGTVWEGPEPFEPHLRELARLEFLHEQTGPEEPTYVFKHALTQEVAYGSLLERYRRLCHGAVGLGLERLYAGRTDEVVELLAHHFGRSAESEKAVDYAILAAEKAQRRWANIEALAYFDAALKRLEGIPDTEPNRLRRIDAVIKQAEVKFALGRHAEHIQALEGIRDLVAGIADPQRRAAWHYWTGFLHSLTGGRPEVAIAHCREAVSVADAGGFDDTRAFAECCLAQVYTVAGALKDALAAGERALSAFETRGNVWWACRTLWHLSSAANALGEWEQSLEYCRRALDHGRVVNDLRLKVVGWWRTGSTHVQRGDPTAGLRCYEEALALSPIPFDAAMIGAGEGYGLIKAGQVGQGIAQLAKAVAWFDRSHLRYTRSSWALRLAEGHLRRGERGQARVILEEVLTTCRELGYRHLQGVAERLLGECLIPEDPVAASGHLEAASRTLEEVAARDEVARVLLGQAELRRAVGDPDEARRLLKRALAHFENLGTLDEPPRVRAALAALEGEPSA